MRPAETRDRAKVLQRAIVGIVREDRDGQRAVRVRDELTIQIFDSDRAAAAIRDEVMQTHLSSDADLKRALQYVVDIRGVIELILNPLEDRDGRAVVDRGILRLAERHERDDQAGFIHPSGWEFSTILINGN